MSTENKKELIQKIIFFIRRNFFVLFFLTLITSLSFGFLVFYLFLFIPSNQEIISDIDKSEILINVELYQKLEEKIKNNYQDISQERIEDDFFDKQKVDLEIDLDDENSLEDISLEDLESILAQTLYQFYDLKGDNIPTIYERSLIWEELGLGQASEYRGDYNQNIIFLRELKTFFSDEN